LLKSSGVLLYINMIVPKWNCGGAGVTGNRDIVIMQQSVINDHVKSIDAKLSGEEDGKADLL